jgi:Uma2 family endonuclease
MPQSKLLTLEEFLDSRFDLPDSGQWAELEEGRVVLLDAPDLDHGNAILNFSKAVAAWAGSQEAERAGGIYACFDLGLILRQEPDTVRFPAVSFFGGGRFAESDKLVTGTVPRLVTELASSKDRRERMPQRVAHYLSWGVGAVWVIDPRARAIGVFSHNDEPRELNDDQVLRGERHLPGFEVAVADLFVEPRWWTGRS